MKIYLTCKEVIELSTDYLDLHCPNEDNVFEIGKKMDMVWDEELGMWEDVEEISIRVMKLALKEKLGYKNGVLCRPETTK